MVLKYAGYEYSIKKIYKHDKGCLILKFSSLIFLFNCILQIADKKFQ